MLRQSLLTFSNKFLITVVNFLTVIITAQYLGAEGRGIISLFVLNLTIISMASNFIGGPGLVYLFPRHDAKKLLSASYLWALLSSIIVAFVLKMFNLIQPEYFIHLVILSFIQSIVRILTSYLLSQQKINEYNFVSAIYPIAMFLYLFYAFNIKAVHNVEQYFIAFYIGFGLSFLYSFWLVYKKSGFSFSTNVSNQFQQAFKIGYVIQSANIIQLLNYRFSYFLIDHYYGKHEVGVFSTALSFAETVWIIANSFAAIQYAKIANSKDDVANKDLTLLIIRFVSLFTLAALLVLLVLPKTFFLWMLGNDFGDLIHLFPLLAPGVFFLIFSIHISHYYSGSGNPKMGLLGSSIGLLVTLIAGLMLIPTHELRGAAIATSLSYVTSSLVLLIIFMKKKNISIKELIPSVKSFRMAKEKFKSV